MAGDTLMRLASHALQLSGVIFALYTKRLNSFASFAVGYKIANNIAVRLYLINESLCALQHSWVDPDVEQLCNKLLRDLHAITRSRKTLPYLRSQFNRTDLTDQEMCLLDFFTAQNEQAQSILSSCDHLLKLSEDQDEDDADVLPATVFQDLDISDTANALNRIILNKLQLLAECDPTLHNSEATKDYGKGSQALWHPARLRLHELDNGQDLASSNIVIIVSAMDSAIWQEFRIEPVLGPVGDDQQPLYQGAFCELLEMEVNARIILSFKHSHGLFLLSGSEVINQIFQAGKGESLRSVLERYDLTPKDKVMLSYAIARSYWKYYDSELMCTQWTSDTIWFMPEEDGEFEDQLPLCAYVPLPPDPSCGTTSDILDSGPTITHLCPRIFDLALLLLQIGLAEPFQPAKHRYELSRANYNHNQANKLLRRLEKTDWDGFANNKKYYDKAVKFCLDGKNFITQSTQPRPAWQGNGTTSRLAPASDWQTGISGRREILFKNVVLPLAWLAKGFDGDITYASKKSNTCKKGGISGTPQEPEPEALFHGHIVPENWLEDLKKINAQVELKRRRCAVRSPVRIAVLDTGLNREFSAFKERGELLQNIIIEKDFVEPGAPTMMDTFGHGTFMTRLIMECAPSIEIMVARVAKSTADLKDSIENIKKAILWAGQTGKADIISMSFGFSKDDRGIWETIESVRRSREDEIIFLASAGNSSTDDESFPARHPAVISVYATDCHGVFLPSNSASTNTTGDLLGTYGGDVPDSIREEFSTAYPDVHQPGSSVATAIMAGISATMLAYGYVLPSLAGLNGPAENVNKSIKYLRTTKGMERVLSRLAQDRADHSRLKAVRPMWFWKKYASDLGRYCSIVDALTPINSWSP